MNIALAHDNYCSRIHSVIEEASENRAAAEEHVYEENALYLASAGFISEAIGEALDSVFDAISAAYSRGDNAEIGRIISRQITRYQDQFVQREVAERMERF